jgi:hypothetical protein
MKRALLTAIAFIATLSGCVTVQPRTEVVVDVDAEMMIEGETTEVSVLVRGGTSAATFDTMFRDTIEAPSFPLRISVSPQDQNANRLFDVTVVARTSGGGTIGRVRARGRYFAHQTGYVRLTLEDCCRRVAGMCTITQTCTDCACAEIVEQMPTLDAGVLPDANRGADAAIDAFVPDSGVPADVGNDSGPPPGCMNAGQCPSRPCQTATCESGTCTYASTCAMGESCCAGECSSDCSCLGMPVGHICRAAAGDCDTPEACVAGSNRCPPDRVRATGEVCRPKSDPDCDIVEQCDGFTTSCPADVFASGGTPCTSVAAGICNGSGTCAAGGCMPGLPCSTGNVCEQGILACSPTRCVAVGPAPAATVCNPSAGPCDVAETCGGARECPGNAFLGAGARVPCREAMGSCDRAEYCTGASAACPPDTLATGGTRCREAAGECDTAEVCSGTSATCPPDVFASGGVCRAALPSNPCDVDESCNGASPDCPADAFAADGQPCGECLGQCDRGFCAARCGPRDVCCRTPAACTRIEDCAEL